MEEPRMPHEPDHTPLQRSQPDGAAPLRDGVLDVPGDALQALDAHIVAAGGAWQPDPSEANAAGHTMFDSPTSRDHSITVLLEQHKIALAPSQSLVRIRSKDGRAYLGVVVAGP